MSASNLEVALVALLLLAAAIMAARRSIRSGLALLTLYGAQAGVLVWASRTVDDAHWNALARAWFLVALFVVLAHRIATYAFPRQPAARDRVLVPLVHVAQAWLFLELVVWPIRALAAPPSHSIDAWTLIAPLAVSAIALPWTHKRPRLTRVRVALPALYRPLRVVHLSDLHLGPYLPESRLSWLVDTVSRERADLIAITGDFLTLRAQQDWSPVVRFVERLQAPCGVYACLGNHDVDVAGELAAALRACGVHVLRDEVAWVRGDDVATVAVGGIDWRSGPTARQGYMSAFARLWDDAGPRGPAIVLCHQPSVFRLAPPAFGGIMLAGHLHGGQVGITWGARGVSLLRLFGLYDQGLFVRGPARLYSHRGTGVYGFPLRIGVPSEIAVLDLVPDDAAARSTLDATSRQD